MISPKHSKANSSPNTFHYLVKGDVSGIQDFIFNVKSRGADDDLLKTEIVIF